MKIYGVYHTIFNGILSVLIIILMDVIVVNSTSWVKSIHVFIFVIIIFLIVFKLIIIKDKKIIIIRPLWFLYRDNIIPIQDIERVVFFRTYHTTSSSDEVTFFNKAGYELVNITIYWFEFEVKRLMKTLNNLGIKVGYEE